MHVRAEVQESRISPWQLLPQAVAKLARREKPRKRRWRCVVGLCCRLEMEYRRRLFIASQVHTYQVYKDGSNAFESFERYYRNAFLDFGWEMARGEDVETLWLLTRRHITVSCTFKGNNYNPKYTWYFSIIRVHIHTYLFAADTALNFGSSNIKILKSYSYICTSQV